MVILASSKELMKEIKENLRKEFTITDLGPIRHILGMEITRNRPKRQLLLTQKQYTIKILKKFHLDDANPVPTPIDTYTTFTKTPDDESGQTNIPYANAIGSLMYLAVGTRPDIAFAVQTLSRYSNKPNSTHWTGIKRIFRYLQGSDGLGIAYSGNGEIQLMGYSDADWGSNKDDRKSISGYTFLIGGSPVAWSSKKQATVA